VKPVNQPNALEPCQVADRSFKVEAFAKLDAVFARRWSGGALARSLVFVPRGRAKKTDRFESEVAGRVDHGEADERLRVTRRYSKAATANAAATFKEFFRPNIGMRTTSSAARSASRSKPKRSLPKSRAHLFGQTKS
jgi:hypothetical protein